MKEIILYVKDIIKPYKYSLLLGLLLIFIIDGLSLLTPYLFGKLLDSLKIIEVEDLSWLGYSVLVGVSIFITVFFNQAKAWLELNRYIFQLDRAFQVSSLEKLMGFSTGQLFENNSGEVQSIIQRGTSGFSNFVNLMLFDIIPSLSYILFVAVALFFISWEMALIVITFTIIIIAFLVRVNNKSSKGFLSLQKEWQGVDTFQTEILRNLPLVKFTGQEDSMIHEFKEGFMETEIKARKHWIKYVKKTFLMEIIYSVTVTLILVLGSMFVMNESYTIGTFVVIYTWSSNVLSKAKFLRRSARQLIRIFPGMRKFLDLINEKPSIIEDGEYTKIPYGSVSFRNVSLVHKDMKNPVIKKVDFEISPGESIGIVGHSGAGKSTLVKLLLRVWDPTEGGIYIDNIPLKEFHRNYRSLFGYVEQTTRLFDNSVRYNICFGLENVSDERIWEVLKKVQLDEKIRKTDSGLDTIIGEQGVRLSGGESQRLVIARTIIRKPKVLIFDEATSSLDGENQKLLQEAIDEVSKGVTTIIIAHRISTIKNCDRVIVMNNGEIQEIGKPYSLLQTSVTFKNMVHAEQFHN